MFYNKTRLRASRLLLFTLTVRESASVIKVNGCTRSEGFKRKVGFGFTIRILFNSFVTKH